LISITKTDGHKNKFKQNNNIAVVKLLANVLKNKVKEIDQLKDSVRKER